MKTNGEKIAELNDKAVISLVKGRLDEAETYLMQAARLGDPAGLLTLGIEYEQGRSWNRDLRKAQYLYMQCLKYYHSICKTREEFEAKTISVTSQMTQVSVKINRELDAATPTPAASSTANATPIPEDDCKVTEC
jgi:hypothetical protein